VPSQNSKEAYKTLLVPLRWQLLELQHRADKVWLPGKVAWDCRCQPGAVSGVVPETPCCLETAHAVSTGLNFELPPVELH